MRKIPAASGTDARNGPKKRPIKIAATPQRRTNDMPLGKSVGYRDRGHISATRGPILMPTQYENQSPIAAPIAPPTQIGQNLSSPASISAPRPTNAAQAGIKSEIKASDSPKASINVIGIARLRVRVQTRQYL